MPEHLRALVVILGLSVPLFLIGRRPFTQGAVDLSDFLRRRNLWIGITLITFFAHNFWIYAFAASLWISLEFRREPNPLALYLALLFVAPQVEAEIPGFGLINYLFVLNPIRLLALVVLLPTIFRLSSDPRTARWGTFGTDWCLTVYFLLGPTLGFVDGISPTETLRSVLLVFIDCFLPYYVASRLLTSEKQFKDALFSLVMAAMLLAPVAMFEYARHWLLYAAVSEVLGLAPQLYLGRGDSLRAVSSTGHSLELGYVLAVSLAILISLRHTLPRWAWQLSAATLVGGLIATVSRGPWLGAIVGVATVSAAGPGGVRRLMRLGAAFAVVGTLLLLSPFGGEIIDHLPFVGTIDAENVTYRQRLFEVSLDVISLHPILGSTTVLENPAMEEMRQGQGIIDLVNVYVAVALYTGLVGLSLFIGVFIMALANVWRGIKSTRQAHPEALHVGTALLGAIAAALFMIATVSSIGTIPVLYWTFAGMAVAYGRWAFATTNDPLIVSNEPDGANGRFAL